MFTYKTSGVCATEINVEVKIILLKVLNSLEVVLETYLEFLN